MQDYKPPKKPVLTDFFATLAPKQEKIKTQMIKDLVCEEKNSKAS